MFTKSELSLAIQIVIFNQNTPHYVANFLHFTIFFIVTLLIFCNFDIMTPKQVPPMLIAD